VYHSYADGYAHSTHDYFCCFFRFFVFSLFSEEERLATLIVVFVFGGMDRKGIWSVNVYAEVCFWKPWRNLENSD